LAAGPYPRIFCGTVSGEDGPALDAAIDLLRNAPTYSPEWRGIVDMATALRADPDAGASVAQALLSAAQAHAERRHDVCNREIVRALGMGIERRAPHRLELLGAVSRLAGAEALEAVRPVLEGCLRDLEPGVAARTACLLWRARVRGTQAIPSSSRAALREVLARDEAEARLYAACALLWDAKGEERAELVAVVRGSPALAELARHGIADSITSMSCYPERQSKGEGDGASLRYVGSRCMACGAGAATRYHHLLLYSIGIIESHEVECPECGLFTWYGFET
jgi:hypothetical protein